MKPRTPTDGRPFYCRLCACGFDEFLACEEPDCELESEREAVKRAKGKPQRSSRGPRVRSQPTVLSVPLEPPVFVDGVETFNIAALISFVLSGVRLHGRSEVVAGSVPQGQKTDV